MNVTSVQQIVLSLTVEETEELQDYLDRATDNEPNSLVCNVWHELGEALGSV